MPLILQENDALTCPESQRLKVNKRSELRFLSDNIMILTNIAQPRSGSLDLFVISEPNCDTGDAAAMTKVAALSLPDGCFNGISNLIFRSLPAKNEVVRSNDALSDGKPFINSPDSIICVSIEVYDFEVRDVFYTSFVVHPSALLRHVPSASHASTQDVNYIPWSEWARNTTRWCDKASSNKLSFSGQRWLAGNEIWDFNQRRVKQLGKDFAAETDTAHISVVTEPSRSSVNCITDASSLPYVRIVPKQWQYGNICTKCCLDNDRILVCKTVSIY